MRTRRGIPTLVALCLTMITIEGCPAHSPPRSLTQPRTSGGVGKFVALEDDAEEELRTARPSLTDALAGVAERAQGHFGSRMQVRPIRVPHPPRGASARFNFGRVRRGWITALPREELLTSVAYDRGKVFLGGGFASHRFYALDAFTGEHAWSVAAPDGGPTAAIIEDGKVIFNTESCTMFAADIDTGELVWRRWLGDPLMSQPAAADGLVFSAYPRDGGHQFGAFRVSDGEPVWATTIAADVIQAPQVVDGDVFFATMDGSAYRLNARTGSVRWHRDVGASSAIWVSGEDVMLAHRTGGARAPTEQMIVLSKGNGTIRTRGERVPALYLNGQSRDREMAGGTAGAWGNVAVGSHLGLRNVASGWGFQGSSPAVSNGRAYFAMGDSLSARDMNDGTTVWTRRYAEAEDAQALSPPAVVGSLLIFGTVDGLLLATDVDTGMTVWAYDVGEPVMFQPIVAQGWVYLSTGRGNVIGLELGDAMLDGWHMWGGNARHAGLVETAGEVSDALLASLERPSRGSMRAVAFSPRDESDDAPTEETALEPDPSEIDRELPLRGTEVEARVSGRVAEVFVTQRFVNDGPTPIEAVYMFPLPVDAAVDQMEMRIGERVIEGVIRERRAARREYTEARSEGRRAALLEQQRPNLFAQRVANLMPGDEIDVRLRYVHALPYEDGSYELMFPMVAPRRSGDRNDDADELTDPSTREAVSAHADELPPARIDVTLDAGLPVAEIASPSHDVAVRRNGKRRAALQLEARGEDRQRDFVLRYRLAGDHPRAAVLAHRADPGEPGYFTLLVQPPATPSADSITPRDVTFVVDTSSSMHGRPLQHARALIATAIEGLRDEDRFNIVSFSDEVRWLDSSALRGSEANAERASAFLSSLRARGSTEMVPAIEAALRSDQSAERLPIVVLVTDGFIGNEADVLRAVATEIEDGRLFTFGVGTAVNRFLIERAAEIGRGHAQTVMLSEDPHAAARQFVSKIDRPLFTDVRVDWGGLEVSDTYPRRLPDLFAGQPLELRGRFDNGGHATVRVSGNVNGRRFARTVDVALPDAPSEDSAHSSQASLWARAAVHDRMNRMYLRDDDALVAEVTELGLRHHLVTQWTSFVAVERVEEESAEAEDAEPTEPEARATLSPARSLPGDPEVRIPAPADARAVTIVLPFGETLRAEYERELGVWTARFLIPRDAQEGTYPLEVWVTHADGQLEHLRLWYTVDEAAPQLTLRVEGEARAGSEVMIIAEQAITEADLHQVGRTAGELTTERAQLMADARRVETSTPDGEVISFESTTPGTWRARYPIPEDASGEVTIDIVAVDLAANVRHQSLRIEVLQ